MGLCEYSFAVQFCWHPFNRSMWAVIDNMLVIRFVVDGQVRFVCPIGRGDRVAVIRKLMSWQEDCGSTPRIDFAPADAGCRNPGPGLCSVDDTANDDYVYLAADLATLPGRRFSQKRNHIAALSRSGKWSVARVDQAAAAGAHCDFVRMWADGKDAPAGSQMAWEADAMVRALANADALELDVWELSVDGACCGVSIGERTSADTYTIHFEKALADVRGAYQAICSGVAGLLPDGCVYINREQDLGIEGLRRTKRSWNPVRMEKCLTIVHDNGI